MSVRNINLVLYKWRGYKIITTDRNDSLVKKFYVDILFEQRIGQFILDIL